MRKFSLMMAGALTLGLVVTLSPAYAQGCNYTNDGKVICLGGPEAPYTVQRHAPRGHKNGHRRIYDANGTQVVSHPSGCPWRLFCGCGVSVKVFGKPIRELFLAANWRKFPAASPAHGMVAWRWGHVFYIEEVNGDGTVQAYDPNSGGHLTRIHTVSLRGYHVVNPHGGRRYASAM